MANFPPRAGSGNQSSSQPSTPVGSQPGSGAAPPAGSVTGLRTAGVRPCPSCSTLVNVHATVCPNCGEQIAAKEKIVRCRRCRHRASSNLVLCPHCGRELQPAPSRWLTWGLPLLILLLLCGFLVLRGGLNDPSSWAQAQVARVVRLVQSLGGRLQPDVTISMIPAGQDPNDPLVSQAAQAGVALIAAAPTATGVADMAAPTAEGVVSAAESEGPTPEAVAAPAELAVEPTATQVPATPTAEPPTPTATPAPTDTATNTPASTSTAAATQTPTTPAATLKATLTAAQTLTRTNAAIANTTVSSTTLASASTLTRTAAAAAAQQPVTQTVALLGLATPTPLSAAPTATPVPAATATPAPLAVYEVRRGDTLFEIAGQYDVSVEELLAANGLTEDDVYTIQPGDELKIPAPTPEGGPSTGSAEGEALATPAPATYTVRAGDTILAIALRNDVSVEDMLAANGMSINDARTLQPGDELIVPGPEGIPTATPAATATSAATATGAASGTPTVTPTGVPTPTPTPASVVRVDAPRLRSPENGTAVSCSGQETLTWLQVPSVRPTDLYLVNLGYVNSVAADGKEDVVWVISQQRPVSATSWQLDNNLCGLAPNTAGKQWRWYVEVVEPAADGLRPVSPASPVWGFTWQ